MAPQAIETPRFAPENGAPCVGLAGSEPAPSWAFAAPPARRPALAPQPLEKAQNAPENGAPLPSPACGRRACPRARTRGWREASNEGKPPFRRAVGSRRGRLELGSPEMTPQAIEKPRFAPGNGTPPCRARGSAGTRPFGPGGAGRRRERDSFWRLTP
jgi:hypothetical protein